jgi:hypothetical protein
LIGHPDHVCGGRFRVASAKNGVVAVRFLTVLVVCRVKISSGERRGCQTLRNGRTGID